MRNSYHICLTRIFNLHVTSPRYAGLGISLPLAKEIISTQAGKIWASGKPGEGATYHITLPLARG